MISKKYISYFEGNIPLLITVPHGGNLRDDSIPVRKDGVFKRDINTIRVAKRVSKELNALGYSPYLILMNLHRRKIDVNRGTYEGFHEGKALEVHRAYHKRIKTVKAEIIKKFGEGMMIDLHGQSLRPVVELGYGLAKFRINSIAAGDYGENIERSSFRYLVKKGLAPEDILYGKNSIAFLLEEKGYLVKPGSKNRFIEDSHYNGVYTLNRHIITKNEKFWGLSIELPFTGVRDNSKNMDKFSKDFSEVLIKLLKLKNGGDNHHV